MKLNDLTTLVGVLGTALYFFIAAQGAFYHFGFAKALYNIPAEHFIELRKAVDPVVRVRFKWLYFSSLGILLLWILVSDRSQGFWSYGLLIFALLMLATDMVLVIRVSEPVNELINADLLNTQSGYSAARGEWLKYILIRGYVSLGGFGCLILHFVLRGR